MSSPKSAEINEEMQEDDDSLQQQSSVSCSSSINQETPIPQNHDQEIQNPQNPNQEFPIPQNPDEEISNPQNPFEETENSENHVQETTNPQNPLEETQNPENPEQEERKRQTKANEKIGRKRQLKRVKRRNKQRIAQKPLSEEDAVDQAAPHSLIARGNLEYGFFGEDEETLKQHNAELDAMYARNRGEVTSVLTQESSHEINESGLQKLMQRLQFGGNRRSLDNPTPEEQKRQQQEVEEALHLLYGIKGDEWAQEYKKKVEEVQMDAMYGDDWAKDDKKDQGEKSATVFDGDWEVADDCIWLKRSISEEQDDVATLNYLIAYIHQGTGQGVDDFGLLYGFIRRYGECLSLQVFKKKLAKLLCKYLMLTEKLSHPRMRLTWSDDNLRKLGAQVWGSTMQEGTFPLLDRLAIAIRDQENPTIVDMRASGRSHQGRRFRISQDPTIGRSSPASIPTSVDEAFYSATAINPNRGLAIREAGKPAEDRPPETVPDKIGKEKQLAKEEAPNAPNKRPRKFQSVEQLLILFPEAITKGEDDLILLRYASAYWRNVTSPTVLGLYEFIFANLPTGEGISWFLLKLKLAMLERRYFSILRMVNSTGNMGAYDTKYHKELYRLGRQFWGDEIDDQNPDGNMGTRGASGGASESGGADVGCSQGGNGGANEGTHAVGEEDAHGGANGGGS